MNLNYMQELYWDLPIPEIKLMKNGASAVVLANHTSLEQPKFSGLEEAMSAPDSDLRIFGKPTSRPSEEWQLH